MGHAGCPTALIAPPVQCSVALTVYTIMHRCSANICSSLTHFSQHCLKSNGLRLCAAFRCALDMCLCSSIMSAQHLAAITSQVQPMHSTLPQETPFTRQTCPSAHALFLCISPNKKHREPSMKNHPPQSPSPGAAAMSKCTISYCCEPRRRRPRDPLFRLYQAGTGRNPQCSRFEREPSILA